MVQGSDAGKPGYMTSRGSAAEPRLALQVDDKSHAFTNIVGKHKRRINHATCIDMCHEASVLPKVAAQTAASQSTADIT